MSIKSYKENSVISFGSHPHPDFKLDDGAKCFEQLGTSKTIPANTIILSPGDMPNNCFYIKKGMVMVYEITYNGSEHDLSIMSENSLLFESNMLINEPSGFYFKTIQETELIVLDKDVLLAAMKESFEITDLLLKSLSYKFLSVVNELHQSNTFSAPWRICNMLIVFAVECGEEYDGKILIKHKLSQQMLSNLLGINRMTTVRTIKILKEKNLIELINGLYCIRDIEKLKKYQSELEESA